MYEIENPVPSDAVEAAQWFMSNHPDHNPYCTLPEIGKAFDVDGIQVAKWLGLFGLRYWNGYPTMTAIKRGFVKPDGKKWLWNKNRTTAIVNDCLCSRTLLVKLRGPIKAKKLETGECVVEMADGTELARTKEAVVAYVIAACLNTATRDPMFANPQ
ncbi:MAG: hypothetical protein HYX68_13940 [Planctomycetes bacterium]|nr:hypothetical protein [Planctomycetota bacterium]